MTPPAGSAGSGNVPGADHLPWRAADTEVVPCCVCGIAGRLRYRVGPFGIVQCPWCRLVFVSPRLRADALQRIYDDSGYFDEGGVYGGQGPFSPAMILQRTWTAGRLALLRRHTRPGARLLEVGSGYGLFLAAARRAGYAVRGVELSRTGTAYARDRLGLTVHCGQLADAPADPVDVICAFDTLEHVPDPLAMLRQARQRLAPGGMVLLSLPYISSLPARLLGPRWWTLKPEQHITHFTPATLQLVAAHAGLAITRVIRSPLVPSNIGRLDSMVAVCRALPHRGVGPVRQDDEV